MRIALIGAEGQLGTDLQRTLDGEVIALGHAQIEITDASQLETVLDAADADVVINAAAYNLVDRAEDEPEVAFAVNALGPRNLALYCARQQKVLLHVSTDYVFGLDRERRLPFSEADAPGPVSAYGVSKLSGEYFVRSLCRRHFVVRTCGLYGPTRTPGGGNFVETMLRLASQRDELTIVDDQQCTPTSTSDLAKSLSQLIQSDSYGLYHATNAGATTWCQFAREVFRLAGQDVKVSPITSDEYGAKAPRPRFSVLENRKLALAIGEALPPWQEALARFLANRNARETS